MQRARGTFGAWSRRDFHSSACLFSFATVTEFDGASCGAQSPRIKNLTSECEVIISRKFLLREGQKQIAICFNPLYDGI